MWSHFPTATNYHVFVCFSKITAAFLNSMNVNASSWRASNNDRRTVIRSLIARVPSGAVYRVEFPSIPCMLRSVFGSRSRHKLSQSVTTCAFTRHSLAAKILMVESKRFCISWIPPKVQTARISKAISYLKRFSQNLKEESIFKHPLLKFSPMSRDTYYLKIQSWGNLWEFVSKISNKIRR